MTMLKRFIPAAALALMATGCGLKPHPLYRSRPVEPPASAQNGPAPLRAGTASQKKLLQAAESYLGTPYRFGGTTRAGMDCSGFMQQVYRQAAGIELPRTAADMYRQGKKIPLRRLRCGDLVFFGRSVSSIDHVGMYAGGGRFIHAGTRRGVAYAGLDEKYFRRRYRGAARFTE